MNRCFQDHMLEYQNTVTGSLKDYVAHWEDLEGWGGEGGGRGDWDAEHM